MGVRTRDPFSKSTPERIVLFRINQQGILAIFPQTGVHIDCDHLFGRCQAASKERLVSLKALLQLLSTKEQSFRIFVLTTDYSLLECRHSMPEDQPDGLKRKQVARGRTLWIEK